MRKQITKTNEKIGALYGRASTQELAERETLKQQKNIGIEAAERLSAQTGVRHTIKHFLIEEMGVSGSSKKNRHKFKDLEDLIKTGRISFVVSKEISRLSRSLIDFLDFCELCRRHEVALHIGNLPGVDPNTANGQMMLAVIGAIAQFERSLIIERVKDTLRSAALRDKKINGGPVIYGFDKDPNKAGSWLVNKNEIENIERMMRDYLQHGSLKETARFARENGFTNKSGKSFTGSSIKKLFTNRRIIGENRVVHGSNDEHVTIVELPFRGQSVGDALFAKVQDQLEKQESMRANQNRVGKRIYLFSNLVFSEIGANFSGHSGKGRNGTKHCYYKESKSKVKVNAEVFEQSILKSLSDSLSSQEQLDRHAAEIATVHREELNALDLEAKAITSNLESLKQEDADIIVSLMKAGSESASELVSLLNARATDIRTARAAAIARIEAIDGRKEVLLHMDIDVKKHSQQALEIWKNIKAASPLRQRHFLRQIIEKIELKKTGETIIYWKFAKVFTAEEEAVAPRKKWLRWRDSNPRPSG